MLTRHAITQRADADGVDAAVAERDYVLAHFIAQLHHAVPADGGRLVLKGGTALRFPHILDYRYSADLDFTVTGGGDGPARLPRRGGVISEMIHTAVTARLEAIWVVCIPAAMVRRHDGSWSSD